MGCGLGAASVDAGLTRPPGAQHRIFNFGLFMFVTEVWKWGRFLCVSGLCCDFAKVMNWFWELFCFCFWSLPWSFLLRGSCRVQLGAGGGGGSAEVWALPSSSRAGRGPTPIDGGQESTRPLHLSTLHVGKESAFLRCPIFSSWRFIRDTLPPDPVLSPWQILLCFGIKEFLLHKRYNGKRRVMEWWRVRARPGSELCGRDPSSRVKQLA